MCCQLALLPFVMMTRWSWALLLILMSRKTLGLLVTEVIRKTFGGNLAIFKWIGSKPRLTLNLPSMYLVAIQSQGQLPTDIIYMPTFTAIGKMTF